MSRSFALWRLAALAVVLAAFAVRLSGLEAQSLWYDEGMSAGLATRTFAQIVRNAADDIHPPLYYLLLAAWVRLAGDGVFALRALSAFAGTCVVAGVVALGRRLWGVREGLAGGLLAAASPYMVWYSQEVRMYILAAAWGALLVWLTLDLAGDPPRGSRLPAVRVAWVVVALAALHTHYFAGATALATASAVAIVPFARRWRAGRRVPWRPAATWVGLQLVAAALFLPWLAYAWHTVRDWPAQGAVVTARFVAVETVRTFAVGIHAPPAAALGPWVLGGLVALGVIAGLRPVRRGPTAVAIGCAAVSPTAMWALSLVRPAWDAKFLIVGAPGFELLAGAGAVAVGAAIARIVASAARSGGSDAATRHRSSGSDRSRLGRPGGTRVPPGSHPVRASSTLAAALTVAALAIVLWPRGAALVAMSRDPAYQRDDYRGIVRAIDRSAGPADVVLANAPTQVEILGYYDRGRHEVAALPIGRPVDLARTLPALDALGRAQRDIYAVLWATDQSDPDGIVAGWLETHRIKAFERWYGSVRLALWAAPRLPVRRYEGQAGAALPLSFAAAGEDDGLLLVRLTTGPLDLVVGDVLTVEAGWLAADPVSADLEAFLHLVDAGGRIVAQRDMAPRNGTSRTSTWPAVGDVELSSDADGSVEANGEIHDDPMALAVPADAAPGEYVLLLGLYDPVTGVRSTVRSFVEDPRDPPLPRTDALEVGRVRVRNR